MNAIFDDIKREFRKDNALSKIIIINSAVFLFLLLLKLLLVLFLQEKVRADNFFYAAISWLSIPLDVSVFVFKPWTILSYMFVHYELWHIFWNMFFLFWFGRVFTEYLGNRRVLPVYIYGGIAGAILSILFYHLFPALPVGSMLLGASAAVYAIMLAITTLLPNYSFYLLLIGPVQIKYIVLFKFLIDLISLSNMDNMGGNIAHIGGALIGYLYTKRFQKGYDWTKGFNTLTDKLIRFFSPSQRTIRVVHKEKSEYVSKRSFQEWESQEVIDEILDKISKSGYDSLSKEEKDTLFRASKDSN